jgi:DNA-binding LacI/PurR family transcriptional regulator
MGERAMEMLISRIKAGKSIEPRTEILPTSIVVRESTKKR